jgi:hypothetical protein
LPAGIAFLLAVWLTGIDVGNVGSLFDRLLDSSAHQPGLYSLAQSRL